MNKDNWEAEFDKRWYLYPADDNSRNIQQEIKEFIRALLEPEEKECTCRCHLLFYSDAEMKKNGCDVCRWFHPF